jgi:hypothetical protein
MPHAWGSKPELIGQEVIAHELGVTSQAVSNWYKRAITAPEDSHLKKMPPPTFVEYTPGKTPMKVWRRAQLPAWQKWYDKHLASSGKHVPIKQRRDRDG